MIRSTKRVVHVGKQGQVADGGHRTYLLAADIALVDITVYIGDVIQENDLTQPDIDWVRSINELHSRIMQYAARAVYGWPTERVDPKVRVNTNGIHVTIYTTTGTDHVEVIGVKADIGADLLTDAITDDLIEALAQFPGWSDTSWVVRVEEGEEA